MLKTRETVSMTLSRAAAIIESVFSEEERNLLYLDVAGRTIPLQKQIEAYWRNFVPVEDDEDMFLTLAALVRDGNEKWFKTCYYGIEGSLSSDLDLSRLRKDILNGLKTLFKAKSR